MPNITPEMLELMKRTAPKANEITGKKTAGFSTAAATQEVDEFGGYGLPDNTQYLNEAQMMSQRGNMPQSFTTSSSQKPMVYRENPNSKLPDAIKNILKQNAAKTASAAAPAMTVSNEAAQLLSEMNQVQMAAQPAPAPSAPAQGLDYTILKAIIKECIDEKFKEFNTQMLNENTLRTVSLKEGTIRLVDNSGNVYKAALQYTGNVNDKKK